MAVEIVSRNEEEAAKPVARDGKDVDLRMREQNITPTPPEQEASLHATTEGTDNT